MDKQRIHGTNLTFIFPLTKIIYIEFVCYLSVNEVSPKTSKGTIGRKCWEDGKIGRPRFIDVLNDVERLTDGYITMDEDRDFLVDRVGFNKEIALRFQNIGFFDILVLYGLEM